MKNKRFMFWRRHRRWISTGFLLVLSLTVVLASGASFKQSTRGEESLEPLVTSVLKVGKADAIVITDGTNTMVIDVGEEEDGAEVTEFLTKQGLRRVDVLIITHFDKDHVGGADTLIESLEIGRVLIPDYDGTSTEYLDFLSAMERKGLVPKRLNAPVEFRLGAADVRVDPPLSYATAHVGAEIDNNFSLMTVVSHGRIRLLFTGDIEKQRIREWLEQGDAGRFDFLKVPHHGVYNTALEALFEVVHPRYAAICSSAKNPADARTVELLKGIGCDVRETKDGRITVVSDGAQLEMHQKVK